MDISQAKRTGILAALLWASFLVPARAVPPGFNIQGRLTDASGVNREGNYALKFTLYDAPTGGTSLWTRTYAALTVRNGNFATVLGDVTGQPILSDVFSTGDSRHLEIQVLSGPGVSSPEQALVPRQQLVSVPYALRAATVEQADAVSSTGSIRFITAGSERGRVTESGNVGIGTTAPLSRLHVVDGDIRVSTSAGQPSKGIVFQDGSLQRTAAGPGTTNIVSARPAANFTTTSTSYVPRPGAAVTINTRGGAVIIFLSSNWASGSKTAVIGRINRDSGAEFRNLGSCWIEDAITTCNYTTHIVMTGLSPGAHTFALEVRADTLGSGGSGNIANNIASNPDLFTLELIAMEL